MRYKLVNDEGQLILTCLKNCFRENAPKRWLEMKDRSEIEHIVDAVDEMLSNWGASAYLVDEVGGIGLEFDTEEDHLLFLLRWSN